MPHGFVTEFVAEQPQVVVITELGFTPASLSGLLKKMRLTEVNLSFEQLSQAEARLAEAYKIIYQVPVGEQISPKILTLLKPHQAQLVIVLTLVTGIEDTKSVFVSWQRQTEAQGALIQTLTITLPQASYVVGQDVISDNWQKTGVLGAMTTSLTQGVLRDPNLPFFPQSESSFWENLKLFLTQPGPVKKVIRGRKLQTSVLAKLLHLHFQRLTGQNTRIEVSPVTPAPEVVDWPSTTTITVESPEELAKLLGPVLEKIKFVSTPKADEATWFPAPPVVIPTPPLVEKPQPTPKPSQTVASPTLLAKKSPQASQKSPPLLSENSPSSTTSKPEVSSVRKPTQPTSEAELDSKLAQLFQEYRSEQKVEQVKEVAQTQTLTKKKSLRKRKFFWAGIVMILVFGLVTVSLGVLSVTAGHLKESLITQDQASEAGFRLTITPSFKFWHQVAKVHQQALSFLPGTQIAETGQLVQVTESLIKFQASSEALSQSGTNLVLAMTGRFPAEVSGLLAKVESQSQTSFTQISEAQLYLENLQKIQSEPDKKQLQVLENQLGEAKRVFAPLQQLQPILRQVVGLDGKKTYALLLQNHQELRPTGGIIQAVAFVTFDRGQIVDTEVVSALNLSVPSQGQTVPADMARFLGVDQVTLQNSNWSPDAPTAADQTISFLEQATAKNIDGVVFINTLELAQWLKVIGPLDLTDYQEVVTPQNVLERLEAHSELQVTQAGTPDYPTAILEKLIKKTLVTPQEKVPALLAMLYQQFESRQMSFVTKDESSMAAFRTLGWSGGLVEPACPPPFQQERCLVDSLAQVETNVGNNKANIYLSRQIEHQVILEPASVRHTHTITFTNRATSNAWPRGSYRAYIRLYTPPTARLEAVSLNGQNLSTEETIIAFENNRQVFGALVEVPIQQTVTLSYDYFMPSEQALPFSYAFFTQFQPGIVVPQYQVSIDTGTFTPAVIAPQATMAGSKAIFKPMTLPHSLVGIRFEN